MEGRAGGRKGLVGLYLWAFDGNLRLVFNQQVLHQIVCLGEVEKMERSKYVCKKLDTMAEKKVGKAENNAEWKDRFLPSLAKGYIPGWWCFRLLG